MHKRGLPSCDVCLDVCHVRVLCQSKLLKLLSPPGRPAILVFLTKHYLRQYSDGDPIIGASNITGVWKKSQFSTNISEMIQDRAIVTIECELEIVSKLFQRHCMHIWRSIFYYFEMYHFQWPWVTSSDLAKYSMTRRIARPVCDSWAACWLTLAGLLCWTRWETLRRQQNGWLTSVSSKHIFPAR